MRDTRRMRSGKTTKIQKVKGKMELGKLKFRGINKNAGVGSTQDARGVVNSLCISDCPRTTSSGMWKMVSPDERKGARHDYDHVRIEHKGDSRSHSGGEALLLKLQWHAGCRDEGTGLDALKKICAQEIEVAG